MSNLINASICLTDIPAGSVRVGSDGRKYLAVCITRMREKDKYENTHTIYIRPTKEEREAKTPKCYVGKGQEVIFDAPATPSPEQIEQMPPADVDDLPW